MLSLIYSLLNKTETNNKTNNKTNNETSNETKNETNNETKTEHLQHLQHIYIEIDKLQILYKKTQEENDLEEELDQTCQFIQAQLNLYQLISLTSIKILEKDVPLNTYIEIYMN